MKVGNKSSHPLRKFVMYIQKEYNCTEKKGNRAIVPTVSKGSGNPLNSVNYFKTLIAGMKNTKIFDIGYPHNGRADKNPYPHDRRADKDSYPHDSNNQCIILINVQMILL